MHKEYILLNGFRKAKRGFTAGFHVPLTGAVLRLVWPSILLQSARDRVATDADTVTAERLWSAMSVKQRE